MVLLLVHLQRAMWLKLKGGPDLPGKQPRKGADRSAFDTDTLNFFPLPQGIKKIINCKKKEAMQSVVAWLAKYGPTSCLPEGDWKLECNPSIALPQQANVIDCGPYVYKYMECISAGL
jgi:hypothetical protein